MAHFKTTRNSVYILLLICCIPRVILSVLNKEANDDHVSTIIQWQGSGVYPDARDCWECFQPPLFYAIIKTQCALVGATQYHEIFNVIQFTNLIFSILVCWLIIWFIHTFRLSQLFTVALSLFWGLNPELVSIGALATNDILVILLGISFSIAFLHYLHTASWQTEIALYVLLFLLGITKGTGLLFVGIAPLLIAIKLIKTKKINGTHEIVGEWVIFDGCKMRIFGVIYYREIY